MKALRRARSLLAIAATLLITLGVPAHAKDAWNWLKECDVTVMGAAGSTWASGEAGTTTLTITDDYSDRYYFDFQQDAASGLAPATIGATIRLPLNLGMPLKFGLTAVSSAFSTEGLHGSLNGTLGGMYLGYQVGRLCPLVYVGAVSYKYTVDDATLYGAHPNDQGAIVNGELIPVGTTASLSGTSFPGLGAGVALRVALNKHLYVEASLDYWPGGSITSYQTSFSDADFTMDSPARPFSVGPTTLLRIGFGLGPNHIPF